MIVWLRPGWVEVHETIKDHAAFKVYVCTQLPQDTAHELWRLLDPNGEVIPFEVRIGYRMMRFAICNTRRTLIHFACLPVCRI